MELTSEQLEAVAHFRMGSHLRLEAGAGVGKTSLLEVMGRATSKFGTYTAFNRAVVQDAAARMPGNIQASTTHSLAFRAVGRRYAHRLDAPRIRSAELARRLNLSHLTVRYGSQSKVLQAGFLASLVQRTLTWTAHPELACFRSWDEVLSYTEQDPSGGELALMVSLVEEFGTDQILASLANMPAESDAQVVVSTAHAAKGRQWPTVRLGGDFQDPEGDGTDGELRLLYVAATRAQRVLDVRACQPLVDMINVEQDDDEQRTLAL